MKLSGLTKFSTVDYSGKVCVVVHTAFCNWNCGFCYNKHTMNKQTVNTSEVMSFLRLRAGVIGAVCITGGEPTLQPDLKEFIKQVKGLGYMVKLDTNGSNPDVLEEVLPFLDYVAMDIKAPFEKYTEITCCPVDIDKVKRSISILRESGIEYEFRTTLCPGLSRKDILEIGRTVTGCKRYVLQQCKSDKLHLSNDSVISLVSQLMRSVSECCARGL